jgi:hypothetical protein
MANQRRVRIDAIVNAIKRGEYDDRLGEIQEAITARNEERQEHVLKLVKEVYGNDFVVTKPSSNPPPAAGKNPFIDKAREAEAAESPPPPAAVSPEPEPGAQPTPPDPLPPEIAAQLAGEATSPLEQQMEPEIERRGPSIGAPGGPAFGPGQIQV